MRYEKDVFNMSRDELYNYLHSMTHSPKELRRIHKALKKLGRPRDGIRFEDRYPDLPICVSVISLIIAIVLVAVPVISQILS